MRNIRFSQIFATPKELGWYPSLGITVPNFFGTLPPAFACIIDDIKLLSVRCRSISLLAGHASIAEYRNVRIFDIGRPIRRKVVV